MLGFRLILKLHIEIKIYRTIFVFWNEGEKTISHNDIVIDDSLRLKFHEDTQVLTATILKSSRDVIRIQATPGMNQNEVILNFDFLDSNDGAVIEILHTSENLDIEFLGTVRGLPKGMRNFGKIIRGKNNPSKRVKSPSKLAITVIATGILVASVGFFVPLEILEKVNNSIAITTMLLATGLFYSLTGVYFLFLIRRKYPKSLHVDELE